MLADDMKAVLGQCDDFQSSLTLIDEAVQARGHLSMYSPCSCLFNEVGDFVELVNSLSYVPAASIPSTTVSYPQSRCSGVITSASSE